MGCCGGEFEEHGTNRVSGFSKAIGLIALLCAGCDISYKLEMKMPDLSRQERYAAQATILAIGKNNQVGVTTPIGPITRILECEFEGVPEPISISISPILPTPQVAPGPVIVITPLQTVVASIIFGTMEASQTVEIDVKSGVSLTVFGTGVTVNVRLDNTGTNSSDMVVGVSVAKGGKSLPSELTRSFVTPTTIAPNNAFRFGGGAGGQENIPTFARSVKAYRQRDGGLGDPVAIRFVFSTWGILASASFFQDVAINQPCPEIIIPQGTFDIQLVNMDAISSMLAIVEFGLDI